MQHQDPESEVMGGASGLSHVRSYNTGRLMPTHALNAHEDMPGIISESDMERITDFER